MSNPERQLSTPNRPSYGREITRFLGGSPLSVAVRLAMLSIIVGVILSAIGLDPLDIVQSIDALFRTVWNMGFDAVVWVWRYFLLGAVLVIPIWLIVRLAKSITG
jgi:hypothetical protein